ADTLTDWHETFYWVVLGLAALHLVAIAYYTFATKQDLVGPMLTGRRSITGDAQGIGKAAMARIVIAALLSVGTALWVATGAPPLS
ncbi:MAG: hypothetical protein AAGE86_14010, partial [Pseudomonadota bacterium]